LKTYISELIPSQYFNSLFYLLYLLDARN